MICVVSASCVFVVVANVAKIRVWGLGKGTSRVVFLSSSFSSLPSLFFVFYMVYEGGMALACFFVLFSYLAQAQCSVYLIICSVCLFLYLLLV